VKGSTSVFLLIKYLFTDAEKTPNIVIFTLSIPSRTRSFGPSYVYGFIVVGTAKGSKSGFLLIKYLFAVPNAAFT
jgi:hypothetical protein